MAKYLQKVVKRSRWWPFFLGMFVYALLLLGAGYFGLRYLWQFIEAYEASRPANTLNAYMDNITVDHACDGAQALIDSIDRNLQSVEECREVIKASISEEITCAKKSAECTDTKLVYVLRSGKQVFGEMVMTAGAPDEFGFTRWEVTEESFDFSFLIGQSASVTVPNSLQVYVGDYCLDSAYIIEEGIQYEEIADYYESYDLPYQVTYEAGPILGDIRFDVKDCEGADVTVDANTDMKQYFQNCTEEEIADLDGFIEKFVGRYVTFTGSANRNRQDNYAKLLECVVPGTDLAKRLNDAIEGLHFAQSRKDVVVSISIHYLVRLEDGRYLCNFTYEVDTTGTKGVVRTSTNMQMIVVDSDGTLKTDSMSIY